MLKLCWFLKILICVICGIVPSQFTVHLTMLCKETALEQGGDPLGERLCAVRAVLCNGVGARGSLVSESLQQGLRLQGFKKQQVCLLKSQNVTFEPKNKNILS